MIIWWTDSCKCSLCADRVKNFIAGFILFLTTVSYRHIADRAAAERKYPKAMITPATIDEIMLMFVKGEK